LAAVLLALVPTAAQARYLHASTARQRAGDISRYAGESVTVGRCWRGGTHIVTCSVYIENARVPFTVNGENVRGQAHLFVKVIQRDRRVRVATF